MNLVGKYALCKPGVVNYTFTCPGSICQVLGWASSKYIYVKLLYTPDPYKKSIGGTYPVNVDLFDFVDEIPPEFRLIVALTKICDA